MNSNTTQQYHWVAFYYVFRRPYSMVNDDVPLCTMFLIDDVFYLKDSVNGSVYRSTMMVTMYVANQNHITVILSSTYVFY